MKNKWMWFSFFLLIILFFQFFFEMNKRRAEDSDQTELPKISAKYEIVRKKYSWHRWYHQEYAAELRMQQYDKPTKGINDIFYSQKRNFIPIETVTSNVICSRPSNTVFDNDFIYWSARVIPLEIDDETHFYSTSYIGKGDFAHSNKAFDAFVTPSDFKKKQNTIGKSHGLTEKWIKENKSEALQFDDDNPYGNSAIFSYNSGDVDGDGNDDFIFNDSLILSSKGYKISGTAPRRGVFWNQNVIGLDKDRLDFYKFEDGRLTKTSSMTLKNHPHPKTPYALFVLPQNILAVHYSKGIDFYRVSANNAEYFAHVTGIELGEVQFGAIGDFTGDGLKDVWISQVNTPEQFPHKKDHVSLLDLSKLQNGAQDIDNITVFKINGSAKFSDYDGIGSSLSPVAGDIDNDGKLDLSFTGHRHMNEAGALYVLFGKYLENGTEIDVTAPQVKRILGRTMSQIAPPFHHWDATDFNEDGYDDLVIPVDNDVCSGLHSGSLYLLDGKKVTVSDY